jgi:hypothetical protein
MTELTDLSETDASNILITAIDVNEGCAPSGINNAIRNTLGLIRRAFKSSIFRLRDSTDQTKLLAYDLSGLPTATTITQVVPGENGRQALAPHLAGMIWGLTLSNNALDATNDLDTAVGTAIDSTNTHVMTLAAAMGKRADAAWTAGGTPAVALGGRFHAVLADGPLYGYLIKNPTTGVVDTGISDNANTPTGGANYPAGFTLFRRLGAMRRLAGVILGFRQVGDRFTLVNTITDVNSSSFTTSRSVQQSSAPPLTIAHYRAFLLNASTGVSVNIGSTFELDQAPVAANGLANLFYGGVGTTNSTDVAQLDVQLDSSAQLAVRSNAASTTVVANLLGWTDTRGRNQAYP